MMQFLQDEFLINNENKYYWVFYYICQALPKLCYRDLLFLLLSQFLKERHYRNRIYYKIYRNVYTGLIYIWFKNET